MRLSVTRFGTTFQNPVFLAAGTCGFGEELEEVVDLEALGGMVTKSVTVEPRKGNPAPRVAEVGPSMINSIGLANPGLDKVRAEKLPWLARNLRRAKVFVSVAGRSPKDYWTVIEGLDGSDGFVGFELNLSCPNDARMEKPFALDPEAVAEVTAGAKARTQRPVLIKLAPNDPDMANTARRAESAGADGLTLVNTLPGITYDLGRGRPRLGAGHGGLSGPAVRGAGLLAVTNARRATTLPLVGVGGIAAAADALEYFLAGASLVQVGTASFAEPRAAEHLVRDLEAWGRGRGIADVSALVGAAVPRPAAVPEPAPDVARVAHR